MNQALEKFRSWLSEQYSKFIKNLFIWLNHKKDIVKVTVLRTLFTFIERGGYSNLITPGSSKYQFDNDIFNRLTTAILCQDNGKVLYYY